MSNKSLYWCLIVVLALVLMVNCQTCNKDQVWHHQKCISCYQLTHTVETVSDKQSTNSCSCVTGYEWSENEVACLKLTHLRKIQDFQIQPKIVEEEDYVSTSRLLTTSCDTSNGFIFKNNQCINCRDIPYSSGYAQTPFQCYCNLPYVWWTYFQMCGCYVENVNNVYMSSSSSCTVCSLLSNPTLSAQCITCNGGPFGYGAYGCVNCTAIPFGAGAILSANIGTCACKQGYSFNFNTGACICSKSQWYAIIANGSCVACSSQATAALYIACILCNPPFYFDGYVCLISSLIGNLSSTSKNCPTNFIFTTSPITNQTLRCVCSFIAGYYTNGNSCQSCTTQPIPGIAATNCLNCDVTSGFYLATKECIYCLNAHYTTGIATVSGCQCITDYFWSAITSSCQCDWTIGYYGTAGSCINCYQLQNTVSAIATRCICIDGYKWNGTQCICDPMNGAFFIATQCINCNTMIGATDLGVGGNKCTCIIGYIWSSTLGSCVCDYTNNFYQMDDICYDCSAIANTIGGATISGCNCIPTLTWISSLGMCGCPLGFVHMGTYCGNCLLITLPTGTTIVGCQTCNNTQGYFLSGGICYACSKQQYTSNVVTSNGCGCLNSSMIWQPNLNGCVCNFLAGRITLLVRGTLYCVACYGPTCNCGFGTGTIYINGICVNCATILFSTGLVNNGQCVCFPGYSFSSSIYPFKCYCSFKLGYYLAGSSCNNCASLSTTGGLTSVGCQMCSYSQGFLRLSNDTCILCSSLPNTNGLASISGCGCKIGIWDPVLLLCSTISCPTSFIFSPQNQVCICNATNFINSAYKCVSCSNITNSTGIAQNSTACVCISKNSWTINRWGVGSCALSCNPATSVMIGNVCVNCLTVQYSSGPLSGTNICQCRTPFIWVFTSATNSSACVCQDPLKYILNGNSCVCNPTFSMTITTGNSTTCVDCRTIPYTTNITVSNQCGCINNFNWDNVKQLCICFYPYVPSGLRCVCDLTTSLMIGNQCFSCIPIQYSTGLTSGTNSCQCLPALVWVYTASNNLGVCVCQDPLKIPANNGSSCLCNPNYAISVNSQSCIDCRTIQYSTNSTISGSCGCLTPFVWNTISYSCVCSSDYIFSGVQCICNMNTSVLIGNLCINCLNIQFSNGPIQGTNNCMCPSPLIWIYSSSNHLGACVCQSPLQIPSNDGLSCLCNSIYAITSNNQSINPCFDCRTVQYSTNSTALDSCECQNNFVWNGNTQTCQCISPNIIKEGQCGCDISDSVIINNLCFNCLTVTFSTGPIIGTINCQCPAALTWVYTTSTNSGVCICQNPLQIPSIDGSSCLCNSAYAVQSNTPSINVCLDCRTVQYSTNSTVLGSCECQNNFIWNGNTQTCQCLFPDKISEGQCLCDLSISVLIGNLCLDCLTVTFSTGPVTGTSNCQCPTALVWVYTASTNSGACICQDSLQIPSVDGSSCICNPQYAVSVDASGCLDCRTVQYSTNQTVFNECGCLNNFVWSNISQSCVCLTPYIINGGQCICDPLSTIIINNSCFVCSTDSFSTGISNGSACLCISPMIWNGASCVCNNTSAYIAGNANSSIWQCVDCTDSTTFTLARISSTTCSCINSNLVWNSLGYCDCGQNRAMIIASINSYVCIICDSSIYSNGQSNSNACACPSPLTWNPVTLTCDCGTSAVVIVLNPGVYSCLVCNSTIYATNVANTVTCNCINSQFIWQPNYGCVCSNPQSVAIGIDLSATCVICNAQIYSTGKDPTSNNCLCQNNLAWINGTCKCNANSALLPNISCVFCGALSGASGLLNTTTCKCISFFLTWLPTKAICGCTDNNCIFIGASTYKQCYNCSNRVYATTPNTSTTCNCMSFNLTWNNTSKGCDCGLNNAFYLSGSNFICVDCTNSSFFTLSRRTSTSCNCLSSALVWSSTNGACECRSNSAVIFISGNSFLCINCNSAIFAAGRLNSQVCNCLGNFLIWSSISSSCTCDSSSVVYVAGNYSCITCSSSVYALNKLNTTACSCIDATFVWTGNFCNCSVGSIILPNFKCLVCPTLTTLSNFTCSCFTTSSPNSIWNDITQTCVTCGSTAVPNSVAGYYGVACACVTGYIWDVMTNACISNCPRTGCTMNCASIPNVASLTAILARFIIPRNLPGGTNIKNFYQTARSNYANISSMACQCNIGYSWDSIRLRCYSTTINLF